MRKKILILLAVLFLGSSASLAFADNAISSLVNSYSFTDVDDEDVEILYLAELGIIEGYPDKTVKSEKTINRAEAMTLYARMFNLDPAYDPNCSFSDVAPDIWYAGYVSAMCNAGLVNGYFDGTFKANNQINRAEAIKILLLGLDVDLETDFSHLPTDVYPDFWYTKYADYAAMRNISPIKDGEFDGDKPYTRGDLFTNIYRIKRLLELDEEIYYYKLDPIVVDENYEENPPQEPETGTPDLVIKDITAGGWGFSSIYLDAQICNEGKRADFAELKLKVSDDYYKVFENLTLDEEQCYSTGYYGRPGDKIVFTDIINSWGETVDISVEIDSDNQIAELNENNNKFEAAVSVPLCGNDICEVGENQGVCPFDCEIPCESEFCNEKVVVFCGCDGRDYLLNACTFNEPCAEDQCTSQVPLFDEVLEAQTKVYDCLADYFDYTPLRVPFIIYAEKNSVCNIPGGCPRPKTNSATYANYIINPSLQGYVSHGEIYPTEANQLIIDEHEMTHYFLFQMLHSIPMWFHEGVAIQTDARLDCDVKAHPFNSGIGYEKTLENGKFDIDTPRGSGFWSSEDPSIVFDEGFYEDLKAGKITISPETTPIMYTPFGTKEAHRMGSLFMMGLKLDYNCTQDCVRDIILKLKEFEDNRCPGPECGIALVLGIREGEETITNAIIKEKVNEVVGEDTTPLFELLGLE